VHFDGQARGGVQELADESLRIDPLGAEQLPEAKPANLLERKAEAAQRGRVSGDDLQGGGVQDQRPGGPLLEGSLVRGIGTRAQAVRAQASQQPEPESRTGKDSGQCAKTKCQLIHTLPRRLRSRV